MYKINYLKKEKASKQNPHWLTGLVQASDSRPVLSRFLLGGRIYHLCTPWVNGPLWALFPRARRMGPRPTRVQVCPLGMSSKAQPLMPGGLLREVPQPLPSCRLLPNGGRFRKLNESETVCLDRLPARSPTSDPRSAPSRVDALV